jgi:hypothetical protein
VSEATSNLSSTSSALPAKAKNKGGAPKGNRNAAKLGEDLRLELYLSKTRRGFLQEFFELRFGRPARDEEELREIVRQIAYSALDRVLVEEFERHQPGRIFSSSGETF